MAVAVQSVLKAACALTLALTARVWMLALGLARSLEAFKISVEERSAGRGRPRVRAGAFITFECGRS